jgi:uncharacterized damage-inducible protein DinB
MMKLSTVSILLSIAFLLSCASKKAITTSTQENIFDVVGLPYYKLPSPPAEYSPETTVARMLDGLGFRYYWATQGLKKEDIAYKISPEAQSIGETLEHIYELTAFYENVSMDTTKTLEKSTAETFKSDSYEDILKMRNRTLQHILKASNMLKSGQLILDKAYIKGRAKYYPFWFVLNGQLEDAIWHTGQIASLRRGSGNPIPEGVNFFLGKGK